MYRAVVKNMTIMFFFIYLKTFEFEKNNGFYMLTIKSIKSNF